MIENNIIELTKMKKILVIISFGLLFSGCNVSLKKEEVVDQVKEENKVALTEIEEESEVSQIREEDVINIFWELINEKRIPEAIEMMSPKMVYSEGVSQAYGVQFNQIDSVRVLEIEPYFRESWNSSFEEYKVSLEVKMKESALEAVIPNYGWGENPNVRFISLSLNEEGRWQIGEIATGP